MRLKEARRQSRGVRGPGIPVDALEGDEEAVGIPERGAAELRGELLSAAEVLGGLEVLELPLQVGAAASVEGSPPY